MPKRATRNTHTVYYKVFAPSFFPRGHFVMYLAFLLVPPVLSVSLNALSLSLLVSLPLSDPFSVSSTHLSQNCAILHLLPLKPSHSDLHLFEFECLTLALLSPPHLFLLICTCSFSLAFYSFLLSPGLQGFRSG